MDVNRIRELREGRGWTMEELAVRVAPPTTASQISKLEKGRRKLTYEWMQKLALTLGCYPQDLVDQDTETLSYQEQQLLATFRGLSDVQQEAFLHAASALATPRPGKGKS
ncbi:MAG: helix-turn-helix transcriptional regulator [Rhodospirillales bacterium]|nr:helix-turn-helix transcriptional regulator [Rhodospirillales bacterium]